MRYDDDGDSDRPLEDWEYPDGEDDELQASTPVRTCPKCGCDVYDDVIQCPLCSEYFTREEHATTSFPLWVRVTAVLVLGLLAASVWNAMF